MTAERFLALVAAYGADARRWPDGEREAARAFALANPEVAHDALAEADDVDALLFASRNPQPSMALRDRVIASATEAGLSARQHGGRWMAKLALAFGAGGVAVTAAGVMAGVLLTAHLTADARADAVLYQASLFGVDDVEVLG